MNTDHRTISLAEQVFDRLENEILSGFYQRGELLTEMKLVSDLGVSRTPIREALHRLEQEHLIDITQKGFLVLGVTKEDLADIFEIREKIEGIASRLAAERITDEQLAEVLKTKGYIIARRTIAKYREQLGLPVGRLRKEL